MSLMETRRHFEDGGLDKHEYIALMHRLHALLFEYPEFMASTDIGTIEITDQGVTMTTRDTGIVMRVDSRDERLVPIETLNFHRYEPTETDLVMRLVRPGATVYDIGANIGWYSLNLSRALGESVTIHAFEPIRGTFDMLEQNLAANSATSVRAHNMGLSDRAGELVFYFYPEGSGNTSTANLSGRDDVVEVTCPVTTLDEFSASAGGCVDFIKCDVEGAELMVFSGGARTIERCRPIVFAELLRKWSMPFGYHPNDVLDFFGSLGYQCYVPCASGLRAFGRVDDDTVETNYFFLHPEQHARELESLGLRGA